MVARAARWASARGLWTSTEAASWEEVKVAQIGELGGATCRPRIPRAAVLLDLDTLLLRSRDRAGPWTARSRNISDSLVLSI